MNKKKVPLSLSFKPLTSKGPGSIYLMLNESYRLYLTNRPGYRGAWRQNWKEYDHDVFAHPATVGQCGFCSYAGRDLAGFASFDPRGNDGRAIIGHNCILPEFRNQGYGYKQLRELLRVLTKLGFRMAVASTGHDTFFAPALRMYKSCGFYETGTSVVDKATGFRTIQMECDLSINVRRAEEKDFPRVVALFKQLWPGKALHRKRLQAVSQAMQSSGDYELLSAERKDMVVGFASVSIQHNFWQEGFIAYITTLVVDRRFRKKGIGARLIGRILEIARDRGCARIELESAFHRTDAHAFYEKNGFAKRAYFFSRETGRT